MATKKLVIGQTGIEFLKALGVDTHDLVECTLTFRPDELVVANCVYGIDGNGFPRLIGRYVMLEDPSGGLMLKEHCEAMERLGGK